MLILITGANRGLGLNFVKLALTEGHEVIALVRDESRAENLKMLQSDFSKKLTVIQEDLSDFTAMERVAKKVGTKGGLDVLINNAGILLKTDTAEDLMQSYRVNSVAPFLLTKALLPALKLSANPKVIQITSLMGSIEDNSSGGYYGYRSSKAALNMLNRSLAIDNPWLISVVVHPGWVQTDMGGSGAPLSISESTEGIWKLAKKIKANDSGQFYDYRAETLPW